MKKRYAALLPAVLVACSAQKGTGYQGDPQITLHGVAESVNTVDGVAVPVDVALVWYRALLELDDGGTTPLNSPKFVASVVPVNTSFPAAFTLDVLGPPPSNVLAPCEVGQPGTPSYAVANIVALRRGADLTNVQASDILGQDYRYTVYYAQDDIPEGTVCAPGAISAGLHVFLDGGYEPPAGKLPVPVTIQAQPPALVTTPRTEGECAASAFGPQSAGPTFFFRDPSTLPPDADPDTLPLFPCVPPYFPVDALSCELPQIPESAWVNGSCLDSTVAGWCAQPYPDGNPDCREVVVSQATDLTGVIGGFPTNVYQYP